MHKLQNNGWPLLTHTEENDEELLDEKKRYLCPKAKSIKKTRSHSSSSDSLINVFLYEDICDGFKITDFF